MSTYADALAAAQQLAARLRAHGVAVSIELQVGVSVSGWLGGRKYAEMSHHTVSRRSQGMTPCLALVKRGRPDVPGPLCNGYGGFDEVYRIITMGWANHPGAGGPLTVAGFTIPYNNARPYVWGTEYEGGLDLDDWTPSFRDFMGRSNAAILEWLDRPLGAHIEHKTWAPTRKVDRLGYTAELGRTEIAQSGTPTEEDDMFSDADRALLNDGVNAAREAAAAANAAATAAANANANANRSATLAAEAARLAADALAVSRLDRDEQKEQTETLTGRLADLQQRLPLVTTATYSSVAAPTYAALETEAITKGLTYADLTRPSKTGIVDLDAVTDAAHDGAFAGASEAAATGGTFTLERS